MMEQDKIVKALIQKFTFAPVVLNQHDQMGVTQWFGENKVSFYKKMGLKGHNGIDFRATIGTPTYAAFDGVVISVFNDPFKDTRKGEYVKYASDAVSIDGEMYRLTALHYHLHKSLVALKEKVEKGQQVAETGDTGKYTSGPHLHFAPYIQKLVDGSWVTLFKNNGYNGAIDPFQFFEEKDFSGTPSDQPVVKVGDLVKNVDDPKVYFVTKTKELFWIENEKAFELGRDEGWWGGWDTIKKSEGKFIQSHKIKIV